MPISLNFFVHSVFPTITLGISLLPHICNIPNLSHPRLFDYHDNILLAVQIMKLLHTHFSPASCYFLPPRPKYLPQHPILTYPQSMFFLNVRDQHSCTNTTCKFILL